jgi:hypothetical protein
MASRQRSIVRLVETVELLHVCEENRNNPVQDGCTYRILKIVQLDRPV